MNQNVNKLEQVKCFLLDMDGTFYLGGKIIEGSLDFIKKVQETGRDFLFLTNNSSHNAKFYVEKLKKMGLTVDKKKVLTSGEATAAIVKEKYPGKRAFVLGNEYLIEDMLDAGVVVDQENP
ncbi:MAG: HAD family hydrolase, partial [Clostridia bacterium]|nr:HAD family hydrolase [Clostridia bacterium]